MMVAGPTVVAVLVLLYQSLTDITVPGTYIGLSLSSKVGQGPRPYTYPILISHELI